MIATRKMSLILGALICVITFGPITSASALTVDVAKKCSALTAKAFPPRETGNPAARGGGGTGLSQHSYFQRCVSNGGNGDSATPEREQ
jgi:hypothetical protein